MRTARHTAALSLLAWASATLIEATLVSSQESVWFVAAFAAAAVKYGALAIVAVPVWRLSEWMGRANFSTAQRVWAHLGMGVVALGVWQGVYYGFLYVQIGSLRPLNLARTAGWQALNAVFTYALLIAVIVTRQMSARLRMQQEREAQLVMLAREAEINALKAQIRPHFLFNVLNSIYALIPTQPAQAQVMVERLGDWMRHTLDAAEESFVPLSAELASVENYLEIERTRFGDRLRVGFDIRDAPLDALVPPFVLQPLVENAVKHGIAPFPGPGAIDIRAATCAGGVELIVRDSGRGMNGSVDGDGRGLSLTKRRLRQLYCDQFQLDLRNLAPNGFEVRLRLPAAPPEAKP